MDAAPYFRWGDARQKIRVWSNTWADASCYETAYLIQYSATERHVPARYVRHSQMCRQLDMSFKKAKKTDISDKARCVRQLFFKIARYVRHVSDKNEKKMQDMSDRTRCVDTITTSKRLQWLLNLLIPIIRPFYFTHNAIHLHLTTCYLIYMHATCMHVNGVCAWVFDFFSPENRQQNTK